MKRALRKTDTTMFIKADGGETSSIAMARCFASYDEAIAFCRANRLTGVELVAQMDDKSELTVAVPESSPDAINFCSTPDSAARGEITILAIRETFLAVSLSLLSMIVLGSGAHIVAGALIVPFLLLRTETSTAMAFRMFDSCISKLGLTNCSLRSLPLVGVIALAVKFIATAAALISSPRETVRAIPGNWQRLVLATDLKHPPELLPGMETDPDAPPSVQSFRYEELRHKITSENGRPLFRNLALLAIDLPAVLYRLFLKSSSLVYLPLIWVSDVPMTVKGVLTLPLERVRRWYAAVLIFVMLSPLMTPVHPPGTLATAQDQAIFTYVFPIAKIEWWDMTRVIAIGVTIGLYFYARKLGEDSREHTQLERQIILGANRLRAVCGVFTMACFLLIVLAL